MSILRDRRVMARDRHCAPDHAPVIRVELRVIRRACSIGSALFAVLVYIALLGAAPASADTTRGFSIKNYTGTTLRLDQVGDELAADLRCGRHARSGSRPVRCGDREGPIRRPTPPVMR
jgi:hypothetical protein